DMVHVYQMSEEGILEYAYDSVGNRTEKKRTLDSGTDEIKYHYDSVYGKGNGRRLLYETAIGVDGVEKNLYGYRYDENGNLVEKSNRFTVKTTGDVELITSGVGVEYWKYKYDVQNRLVKVEKNRDVIAEYGYDVDGMRILSKINDKRTKYIYNFVGNVVYEEDDGEERSYIYGHGKIIAEVKGTVGSSGEVYYYHHDNLGSTRLITDSSGQVVMDQDYLPFGDDLNRPSVLENESSYETGYKYTGQHQEAEIGLYYYGARFYDQRVGRFVSEDSYIGELDNSHSQHLYIYVLQNPMKYVDPTGHSWKETTTTVITFKDGSLRSYSAINENITEKQAVLNAYQNAVNEEFKVAKFSSRVYYPSFLDKFLSGIMFGFKPWRTKNSLWKGGLKELKLLDSHGYNSDAMENFEMTLQSSSDVPLTTTQFILEHGAGISDTCIASKLVDSLFKSSAFGKIGTTALSLFDIGRNANDVNEIIKRNNTEIDGVGLFYLDNVFLMDSEKAHSYFNDFKIVQMSSGKKGNDVNINNFSLEEAAFGMHDTVFLRKTADALELKYLGHQATVVGGELVELSLKTINIAIGIAGML
ncbi:MAG: RHS repeat-associated core domain-containing protein, partial [Halanaerobiales bacterium]|nr:RHS repeat-associated core domain-containing protein [Halanaerobiales bacterium]